MKEKMKKLFYTLLLITSFSCIVPSFFGINTEVYGVEPSRGGCLECGAEMPGYDNGWCSDECYKKSMGG